MAKIKVENTEISVVSLQKRRLYLFDRYGTQPNAGAYYFQMDESQKHNRISWRMGKTL